MVIRILISVCIALALHAHQVDYAQASQTSELGRIMDSLDSPSSSKRITAAKIITRSGFTDASLYEKIASLLTEGLNTDTSHEHIDEMSWLCKALAASGDAKYKALLKKISVNAQNRKLRKYAKQSYGLIEEYADRSKVLNTTEGWDDSLSEEDNRLISMLKSDNISLRRDAAKMITRSLSVDAKVYEFAATALQQMSDDFKSGKLYVDTMAWLCKALGSSGDRKYEKVLRRVKDATSDEKLKRYARDSLHAL